VVMHYIIRAKKGVSATILTGHNHDNQYIRYNIPHTTGAGAGRTLTDSDRVQFRSNAQVLRNDGDDVFRGTLEITGSLRVEDNVSVTGSVSVVEDLSVGDALTVGGVSRFDAAMKVTGGSITIVNATGAKEWSNYSPLNNGSSQWNDAGMRIVGGSLNKTAINLFNNNSINSDVDGGYKDQGRVNFYGVGVTGANEPPQYTASLGYALYGPNAVASDGNTLGAGQYEYRVGFNIAGKSAPSTYVDETALLITRKSGDGVGNGSIHYQLKKLSTYNTTVANNTVVMNSNGELLLGPAVGAVDTVGTVAIQVWNGTFDGPLDRGVVVMPANVPDANAIFAIINNKTIRVLGEGTWNGYVSVRNTPQNDTYTTFTPFENKTTNDQIQILQGEFTSCSVVIHAYRID